MVDEGLTNIQNKISENMEYYGVNSFVKTTANTVSNAAGAAVTYVKDKSADLYQNNEYIHGAVDNVSSGAKFVKDKSVSLASDAYNAASNLASSYVSPLLNKDNSGAQGNNQNSGNQSQAELVNLQPEPDPRPVSEQLKDDKIQNI